MAKSKGLRLAHTSNSKKGMGDYYGRAIKAKIGTVRDSYGPTFLPKTKKDLGTAPTTLA